MREASKGRNIDTMTEEMRTALSVQFLHIHQRGLLTAPQRFDSARPDVFFGTYPEQLHDHGIGGIITAAYRDTRSEPLVFADIEAGLREAHPLLAALDATPDLLRTLLHSQRTYWEMILMQQESELPARHSIELRRTREDVMRALHEEHEVIDTTTEPGTDYLMETYTLTPEQYHEARTCFVDGEAALEPLIARIAAEQFERSVRESAGIADTRHILEKITALEQFALHAPDSLAIALTPARNATYVYLIYHKTRPAAEERYIQ